MTKKELHLILKILERIKEPDSHIEEAIHSVKKNIAVFESMRGQLKDQYEWDNGGW